MSDVTQQSSGQWRTNTDPTSPDGHHPIPPRYWWLKRIALGVVGLLVLLLFLRLWWGHVAETRFQAELARYRAAGQPVEPGDFDPPPIKDQDNAALLYKEALNTFVTLPNVEFDALTDLAFGDAAERVSDLRAWVEANAKALDLAHRARDLPGVDWGVRLRSPVYMMMAPALKPNRQLAKLVANAALYHHAVGDHRAALERIDDMLAFASAIDQQPWLMTHLNALATTELATAVIERMVPALIIRSESERGAAPRDALDRVQVNNIIRQLLDEAETLNALRRTFYCRRCEALDAYEVSPGTSVVARILLFLVGPLLPLEGLALARSITQWDDALSESTWPAVSAGAPQDFEGLFGIPLPVPSPAWSFAILSSGVHLHFRAIANRRMAAVALALRLYQVDHGELPRRLNALVPEYLAEIPVDPLAPDARTLGYLPRNERPILYSVGEDGIDGRGTVGTYDSGRVDYYGVDQPFFLDGPRPAKREDVPAEMLSSGERQDNQ